jgi:hypothetical protein
MNGRFGFLPPCWSWREMKEEDEEGEEGGDGRR